MFILMILNSGIRSRMKTNDNITQHVAEVRNLFVT